MNLLVLLVKIILLFNFNRPTLRGTFISFVQYVRFLEYIACKLGNFPIYRVIHKSLRDFRPLRYSSRDAHAEGVNVNRGTDTPSFCPTLKVLDMSTLGEAADVNPVIKFLPQTL